MDRSTGQTSDLLTLRDGGPLAADRARALADDSAQQARLARFRELRRDLEALAALETTTAGLDRVERTLAIRARRRASARRLLAAAAGIALAVGTLLVGYRQAEPTSVPESRSGELETLRVISRDLEALVRRGSPRDPAERALLFRLADLDAELGPVAAGRDAEARELWRRRVVLLDTLARVRGSGAPDARPELRPVAYY